MTTQYLEYPSTLKGDTVQHWISFQAFEFKDQDSATPTLNIALYIPSDALQTSYKSSYESASLRALGRTVDKAAAMFSDTATGVHSKGAAEGIKDLIQAQFAGMGSEAKTLGLLKAGEKAASLGMGDTKTLMEKASGQVINPYMVAAYKGPSDMREHKFSFKMLPQSVAESKVVAKIVNAFKRAMLPSHIGAENAT